MKKILPLVFVLFTYLSYGQEKNYENSIVISPTEIQSSALLELDFEDAITLNYVISVSDDLLKSQSVNKQVGPQLTKMDLSFLNKGSYTIQFFIDDVLVKSIEIEKL